MTAFTLTAHSLPACTPDATSDHAPWRAIGEGQAAMAGSRGGRGGDGIGASVAEPAEVHPADLPGAWLVPIAILLAPLVLLGAAFWPLLASPANLEPLPGEEP